MLSGDQNSIEDKYTKLLNRGGLMIPSLDVCSFASKCFAMLDIIYEVLLKYSADGIRNSAEYYLEKYSPPIVLVALIMTYRVVSGCAGLLQIYTSTMIKRFQTLKFARML